MASTAPLGARLLRPLFLVFFAVSTALLGGCATHYVDGTVKDIPDAQFARPAQPQPVQLVVEFQTNGKPNARAADFVKPMVTERVKASGLFGAISDKPGAGATLNVTINNVAMLDEAMRKGFLTGLTLGVAGSTVTDGYECTVSYSRAGAPPLVKKAKHAIYTSMGSASDVPGGVKVGSIGEAVQIMVRQVVGVALKELSDDPAFGK